MKTLPDRSLKRCISFDVFVDESNPHESGPLSVVVDPQGFNLHWVGMGATQRFTLTWSELMEMCSACRMEDAASRMKRAVDDIQRAMADKQALKGEIEMGVVVPIDSMRKSQEGGIHD